MKIGDIVPLSEPALMQLAQEAKLGDATGWRRLKEMAKMRIRSLDLSETEVVETIAEHLVRRPVAEATRITGTIDSDIEKTKAFIVKLNEIALKIDPSPTNKQVEEILALMTKSIRCRFEHNVGVNDNGRNCYSKEILRRTLETYCENTSLLMQDLHITVINNTKEFLFNSCHQKTEEELTDVCRDFIRNNWISMIKVLTKQNTNMHPVVQQLYVKHGEDVIAIRNKYQEILKDLKEQRTKANEIIAPINAMAKDLRAYLECAEDIKTIREATAFLGVIEQRNDERVAAISMLAHYSDVAYSALGEVKNTLDSYQSARSELNSVTAQSLEVGVKVNA
jgi:hypothetical protein